MVAFFNSPFGIAVVAAATFAGLLLSVLGFGFTIWQLRRVRTATAASSEAIRALKIRFTHFDAIQECTSAEILLSDLRAASKEDQDSLVRLSDELARALINIAERLPHLDESMARKLQSSIQRAGSIPAWTDCSDEQAPLANRKHFASLREIHRTLVKIRSLIQREQ